MVQWTEELDDTFFKLKEAMASKPILKGPDNSKEFILQTDASERGVGAVLSQEDNKLLSHETRYSAIEKECLGIVLALKHFAVHLVG